MPKARKNAKTSTFYLSVEVIKLLEDYCKETGLSKTVAVERFIKKGIEQHQKATTVKELR